MNSHHRNSGLIGWLKRRWHWFLGGAVVLLLVLYFVATSSPFVKAIILPKVGAMYGAKISAGSISVSPFSKVTLRQAQLKTEGPESVLELEELHVKYSLWSILKGNIVIKELKVVSPKLQIITRPDGTSNIDPIVKAYLSMPAGGPKTFDINNLNLNQSQIRLVSITKSGDSDSIDISGLNLSIDQFKNGGTGKITIGADLNWEQKLVNTNSNNQANRLKARIEGTYSYDLSPTLLPNKVGGAIRAEVQQVQGNWQSIPLMKAFLECDMTPTAIQNLALRFDHQGNSMGQIKISGPMDLSRMEGRLVLEISSLNRQVLNLVALPLGYDCGSSSLTASNIIDFAQQGKIISAMGHLSGRDLSLQKQQNKTPLTQADLDYHVQVNRNLSSVLLRGLELSCRNEVQEWGRIQLQSPMNFAWAGNAVGFKDASLTYGMTNVNLAQWQPLWGDYVVQGLLNVTGKLSSKQDGAELLEDMGLQITNLMVRWNTNSFKVDAAQASLKLKLENYKKATIESYQLLMREGGYNIFDVEGSGYYDFAVNKYQIRTSVKAMLAELLKKQSISGLKADSGEIKFNGLFVKSDAEYSINSDMSLDKFTGQIQNWIFRDYQADMAMVAKIQGSKVRFDRATWSSKRKFDAGGSFSFNGSLDLSDQVVQGDFNLIGLNPNAYSPFIEPIIAPLSIKSSSLNAKGQLLIDSKATSHVKSEISLSDTIFNDPLSVIPAAPINLKAATDISVDKLRKINISLLNVAFVDGSLTQGTMGLTGSLDLLDKKSQINYRIAGLKHQILSPWVNVFSTPHKLIQGEISAGCALNFDPLKDSSFQFSGILTNCIFQIPGDKISRKPFHIKINTDSMFSTNGFELKKGLVEFTPTDKANNQIDLLAKINILTSNLYSGNFSIQGDSIDFSSIHNMFTNSIDKSTANTVTVNAKPASQPKLQDEPEAMNLPIKNFVGNMKLNRVYYGDLQLTNIQAGLMITNNTVYIEPLNFLMNGGSFVSKAAVNLGVRGYGYEATIQADRIPVSPIANTFNTAQKDLFQGEINASGNIKCLGTSGANLKTNLLGQLNFGITNASVNLISPRVKFLLTPIALLLRVPELLNSPVEAFSIQTKMGQGQVQIQPFQIFSPALHIQSEGAIVWDSVLTNSPLNLPINVYLRRSLAEKSNLLPSNAPTNAAFVKLPDFIKMTGTLGTPKPEIDKLAIAKMGLQSVGGIPLQVGGNAVNALENVGNLLTGKKQPTVSTNKVTDILTQSSTNAPTQTNRSPVNTIRAIGNLFNRNKAGATNTSNPKP